MTQKNNMRRFPAEWNDQHAVILAWPDKTMDWAETLSEIESVYIDMVRKIIPYERVIIIAQQINSVRKYFSLAELETIDFYEASLNDTWVRDFGPISVIEQNKLHWLDFGFNGWGNKFQSNYDNEATLCLSKNNPTPHIYQNFRKFILEGGSIETNGEGVLLTTTKCLLSNKRNPILTRAEIEQKLKDLLGIHTIHWLTHGHLEGDDTDGHIDTLARFCSSNTIAYVTCSDKNDSHYAELHAMKNELRALRTKQGTPYTLVPLPMVDPIYDHEGNRLPATYANFLFINQAVLVPTYNTDSDEEAMRIFRELFSGREILSVPSLPLIEQHGSIHCATMHVPKV